MGNTISRPVFQVVSDRKLSEKDKNNGKTQYGKTLDERYRFHIEDYSIQECSEFAFLQGKDFEKIFGKKNPDYGSNLAVVKITNPKTKKSIHRCYKTSSSIHGIKDSFIALSYNSLLELSKDTDSFKGMDELEISKGNKWLYYWHHPYRPTRLSLRLGLLGFILAVFSLVYSIFLS